MKIKLLPRRIKGERVREWAREEVKKRVTINYYNTTHFRHSIEYNADIIKFNSIKPRVGAFYKMLSRQLRKSDKGMLEEERICTAILISFARLFCILSFFGQNLYSFFTLCTPQVQDAFQHLFREDLLHHLRRNTFLPLPVSLLPSVIQELDPIFFTKTLREKKTLCKYNICLVLKHYSFID